MRPNQHTVHAVFLMIGFVVLYWGAAQMALQVNATYAHTDASLLRSDPLLYVLRRDFTTGMLMILPLAASAAACWLFYRKLPVYALMLLWMGLLWFGPAVASAALIYFNTQNLFGPGALVSPWPDVQAYLDDDTLSFMRITIFAGVFVIVTLPFAIRFYLHRRGKL